MASQVAPSSEVWFLQGPRGSRRERWWGGGWQSCVNDTLPACAMKTDSGTQSWTRGVAFPPVTRTALSSTHRVVCVASTAWPPSVPTRKALGAQHPGDAPRTRTPTARDSTRFLPPHADPRHSPGTQQAPTPPPSTARGPRRLFPPLTRLRTRIPPPPRDPAGFLSPPARGPPPPGDPTRFPQVCHLREKYTRDPVSRGGDFFSTAI